MSDKPKRHPLSVERILLGIVLVLIVLIVVGLMIAPDAPSLTPGDAAATWQAVGR